MNKVSLKAYKKKTLFMMLFMACVFVLCGAASAETLPQNDTQNGTVSGGLYVDADQPTPWSEQTGTPSAREFNKTYNVPTNTNIQWARAYVNVYSGSAAGTYGLNTTTKLDGDGDGVYERTLGQEEMNIASASNGTVYWLNDHTTKVYSEYLVWYDVTDYITCTNPSLYVKTEAIDGYTFDGRLKLMALVVAYNDGDSDLIHYWVNSGQDWVNKTKSSNTTFNISSVTGTITNATLYNAAVASKDGNYTFNGQLFTGTDPVSPYNYLEFHTWDVTGNVTAGADNMLIYNASSTASFKSILAALTVKETKIDLNVTGVTFNPGTNNGFSELFANEPNNIAVNIKNNGVHDAGAFNVYLTVDGHTETIRVNSLAAGANTTVTFTGYTPSSNSTVTVNITADSDSEVPETDELNNVFSALRAVYYNGYKGARYTNGSDINTNQTFEGHYDVIYSSGSSAYVGSNWASANAAWTAEQLPIPAGATVVMARLYQSYNYDQTPGGSPLLNTVFNNVLISPSAWYTDRKGFGGYNTPYGVFVYDVTSLFNTSGNVLNITSGSGNSNAMYGAYMVVVYQDSNSTYKKIWINEGADILQSRTGYATNDTEATAYLNFNGVDISKINAATLVSFLATANEANKSKLFINNDEYAGFWDGTIDGPDISIKVYDVLSSLVNGNNTAAYQSYNNGSNGEFMMALGGILVNTDIAPTADFVANATTGVDAMSVKFTDMSTGDVTSWAWDFNNDGVIDSTLQNPVFYYNIPGLFTVKLTVTGPYGSDNITKTGYIFVNMSDKTAPTVNANIHGGSYNTNKVITLSMSETGNIYYTLDGSTPTAASKRYTGPITLTSSASLRFRAYDVAGNPSTIITEKYIIDKTAPRVISTNPKNKAKKVSRKSILYLRFSERIKATINWSKIYVKNLKTGKKVKISKSIYGNLLKIKTRLRSKYTWYAIYIPKYAVRDSLGNKLAKGIVVKFKTRK